MIRCIRLWTGVDGRSRFEEGSIVLAAGVRGDRLSQRISAASASFQETEPSGAFAWHTAPVRQLVITLSGTLRFEMRDGGHFTIHPGDILLAEDTTGSGHSWRLLDSDPWQRLYVVLGPDEPVPFVATERKGPSPL